ncbi:MAG: hypothetical protein AB8H79_15565 [Myxococcota bacterium]
MPPRRRFQAFGATVRAESAPQLDLQPLVIRTIQFLSHSPRGASRRDILAAMNLQPSAWPSLRAALERSGEVLPRGRGPGLRHIHVQFLSEDEIPDPETLPRAQAIRALCAKLEEVGEIDSAVAQEATGLDAEHVRRLLRGLVDDGRVQRTGHKRSTRYRWLG